MLIIFSVVAIYCFYVMLAQTMNMTVASFCKGAISCISTSVKESNRLNSGNKYVRMVVNAAYITISALKAFTGYSVGMFLGLVSDVNDGLKTLDKESADSVRMILCVAYVVSIAAVVWVFFSDFGGLLQRLITFCLLIRFAVGVKRMKNVVSK